MGRVWLVWGCFFGLMSVALGAFAAHGLKAVFNDYQMDLVATANQYIAYHAFALLALGLWNHWEKWSATLFAGLSFVFGIFLFSGSLYAYAFFGYPWLVALTPVGGVFFLIAWFLFAVSIVRAKNEII